MQLYQKRDLTQVLSCEIDQIFLKKFSYRTHSVAASAGF